MSKKIDVVFFTKKYTRCGSCDAMKTALTRWQEEHPEVTVNVTMDSVEDSIDYIHENYPEIQEAPVIEIARGKEFSVVSGNNPDILEDHLGGLDAVWDDV